MIREILFVHHSHTDVGYTHPQQVVLDLHQGYIDDALDIIEETADYPDAARMRWTCEVTGVTKRWWEQSSSLNRDRFLTAVQRGQIEVAAMKWNLTPLMDHSMAIDALRPIQFFRDLGIPVRTAMNTDVNGLPWGMVDALLDHGIDGVSMSINEHYGHAPRPWPAAFKWQSPSGRSIMAYNGIIYGATSDRMLRIPHSIDEAQVLVAKWMAKFEGLGYTHPFLMMQITNLTYHDNNAPQRALPDFIRHFNARAEAEGGVRLRFSTPSEVFERFRSLPQDSIPTLRGDWTDWWNFGAGSTARGTALGMRGQRDLKAARALGALTSKVRSTRRDANLAAAQDQLALFAEHTWGPDHSISRPHTADMFTQLSTKMTYAAEGASLARMLRRDALQDLCAEGSGDQQMVLVANPHPTQVRQPLRLPSLPPFAAAPTKPRETGQDTSVPGNHNRFLAHRQDVQAASISADESLWTEAIELPPLSYMFVPASEIGAADTSGITGGEGWISNGQVKLSLDQQTGGLIRFDAGGRNHVPSQDPLLTFGLPVYETIEGGNRNSMFRPIDNTQPEWSQSWNTAWPATRHVGTLVATTTPDIALGQASIRQDFRMENGDKVSVTYRLLPDDSSLHLHVDIQKSPDAEPHSLYLPMPADLAPDWRSEFETAGAVVELDSEQIPFSSRHYVTTLGYMRMTDSNHEIAVASPDTPLWQVGGYTFGRFKEPDGAVDRPAPALLAWLTNNYWSTNFQADQSGPISAAFTIQFGARRSRAAALQWSHVAALPLATQLCDVGNSGETRLHETGLRPELGEVIATAIERISSDEVAFTLLNPGATQARIAFETALPHRLSRTNLADGELREIDSGLFTSDELRPGEWCRIVVRRLDSVDTAVVR